MISIQEQRAKGEHDNSRDGLKNRIEAYLLSHGAWFWNLIMALPPLRRWVNRVIINRAVAKGKTRPQRLSSMAVKGQASTEGADTPMAGYTSWESLSDRRWFSRYLPPRQLPNLPALKDLERLFEVGGGGPVMSEDSTVLFLSFAQWFTDGFLMTDSVDRRMTHTSHHIDFNPLYGLTRQETWAIREMSEEDGRKGLLKTEINPDGEAYAPRYFDPQGQVKEEFKALRKPLGLRKFLDRVGEDRAAEIKRSIFAFGGERANTTPYTATLNTVFLREHNRLAGVIEAAHPTWDDERVFQTARNINTVLLIKLVVEEYINHISPYYFQLTVDPSISWKANWNKPNWIPVEFNLLYRWHSLTPSDFEIDGRTVPGPQVLYDNAHLLNIGPGKLMESASGQLAWNVGLMNTADYLRYVEISSVKQGRDNELGSYNDYREAFGYPRVTRFEQITGDPARVAMLREIYQDVDNLEYFVGLFAEDVRPKAAVPSLIGRIVAYDAFSLALTHPLLSEHVFNEQTFTPQGMQVIAQTQRLQDILNRNVPGGQGDYRVTMTYGK